MGPLQLIRRFAPAIASKAEQAMFKTLLKDATARDDAIEQQIRALALRAKTPEAQQRAVSKAEALEAKQHPLKIARSNLLTAQYAAPNDDITARLLLSTTDDEQRHLASLLHRGVGYHSNMRGLPAGGVYIEGLSSEVPGGGTQMLKQLEAQYPGAAMYLEAVNNPATKEFYLKKGFWPQPEGASPEVTNLWVKPAGDMIKKEGGPVKMAGGGALSLVAKLDPRFGKAYKEATELGKSLPRPSDEGPGDAARHAYMAARTADLYGPTAAKWLGAAYEILGAENHEIQDMDRYNNARGIEMRGLQGDDLREEVLGALNSGRLRTMPPGRVQSLRY